MNSTTKEKMIGETESLPLERKTTKPKALPELKGSTQFNNTFIRNVLRLIETNQNILMGYFLANASREKVIALNDLLVNCRCILGDQERGAIEDIFKKGGKRAKGVKQKVQTKKNQE